MTTIVVQARGRFFFVDIVNKGIYNAYYINKGGKRGAKIYTGYGCLLFMDILDAARMSTSINRAVFVV